MKKQKIAVGPGASSLMLIAVVLALSVLTVLTMISARNDEALSLRSVETRQQVYDLFASAEKSMAKLDAVLAQAGTEGGGDAYLASVKAGLPEGMRMEGDRVYWVEKGNDRQLECAAKLNEAGAFPRAEWAMHRLGEADLWEDSFDDFEDDFEDDYEEDSGTGAGDDGAVEAEEEDEDDIL